MSGFALPIFWLLLFIGGGVFLAYQRIDLRTSTTAVGAALLAYTFFGDWSWWWLLILWMAFATKIIYSFPVRCSNGGYKIVQGLEIDDFSRERMDATEAELREERAAIEELL